MTRKNKKKGKKNTHTNAGKSIERSQGTALEKVMDFLNKRIPSSPSPAPNKTE